MEFLRSLYGSLFDNKPHTTSEDEIFPLYFLDNLKSGRMLVLSQTFKFNDVLDPEKLQGGLAKLIQNGNWRKFGGRLRQRSDGNLELHVPKEFTDQRPPIQFSTKAFDISIDEHAIGRQFPQATDVPSLHPGQELFTEFIARSNGPTTLHDYLRSDHPILRLHVTTFTDATIVAFVWPHAVAGALGMKNMLAAWSESLKGNSNIPELLGARKDILDGIGTEEDSLAPYVLDPVEMSGWGFAKFAFRLMWTVFWRPKVDTRTICLPREFVSRLRQATIKELEEVQGLDNKQFLSEGDVLTAWLSRFTSLARGGTRPAIVMNPIDVSKRLEIQESGGLYIQNMAVALYTLVGPDMLVKKTLAELAHAVRLSIQQQATNEQMRAQLRHFRKLGPNKLQNLYGNSNSHLICFSNWTAFKLFDAVDFGPAIIGRQPFPGAGKPVYTHCHPLSEDPFIRDAFNITGKDMDGNYWINSILYPEDRSAFENYLKETCERLEFTVVA